MKRTILAAAAAALAATAATAQTKHDMKCGFVTVNDSQHRSAEIFNDKIAKKTGGEVDVRILKVLKSCHCREFERGGRSNVGVMFLQPVEQDFRQPRFPPIVAVRRAHCLDQGVERFFL